MLKVNFHRLKKDIAILRHFIKMIPNLKPGYIPLAAAAAVIRAAVPYLNILLPRSILNELTGKQRMQNLVFYVVLLIVGNAVIHILADFISTKLKLSGEELVDQFELHVGRHIMGMDFKDLEDARILDLKEKALLNLRLQDALRKTPITIIHLCELFFTGMGVMILLSLLNPLLILLIAALNLLNIVIYKNVQKTKLQFYKDIAVYNRQYQYYKSLSSDFSNAKDVRIYHMADYIIRRIMHYQQEVNHVFNKMFMKQRKNDGYSTVNVNMQVIIAYAYAAFCVLKERITIGDFTMYISAVNHFSSVLSKTMSDIVELRQLSIVLQDYLAFEQLPIQCVNGGKKIVDVKNMEITFENVWFQYPGSSDYILKGISMQIREGEKLALVGRNGAGKTTFIKLLCGLYRPDQGRILLNGIDIHEYAYNEYIQILSVLFQDYKLFSFSIKENMVFDQEADNQKLNVAFEKAGIKDKIDKLPLRMETPLYQNFDADGITLSGGEMQKIAIARLFYKDAPIVVLDEPTAALDPYAEHEVYQKLNQAIHNKTTIYISHRLSSCLFCDKIAVLDDGQIIEHGTHRELLLRDGLYADMWNMQAQYYQ